VWCCFGPDDGAQIGRLKRQPTLCTRRGHIGIAGPATSSSREAGERRYCDLRCWSIC
jgi:hypothetical protein